MAAASVPTCAGCPRAVPPRRNGVLDRLESRSWRIACRSDMSLNGLARMSNSVVQGWVNYYRHSPAAGNPNAAAAVDGNQGERRVPLEPSRAVTCQYSPGCRG
ncbi:group II intron maturase-specific domain-containing protein [Streptomyces mirabilis]|uniref:group II intron maturase-specific domain-containing protein n=1 Tax=Streptomyces mirabilis TaxID=68239 RepID=UPI003655D50D